MQRLLIFIASVVLLSGCISNRQVQYLQKNDANKDNVPKDSVLREYALTTFDYKIQPNDLLSVRFTSLTPEEFDFFTPTGNQQGFNLGAGGPGALIYGELVDPQGQVPFPVVGKVKVAGLTIFQIQDTLQQLANRYLESPVVKVRLLNYRITLLGEVNRESSVPLSNNRANIFEAIAGGGGFTELADRSNVKIIRQRGDSTSVLYVNLLEEKFISSPNYYVYQNDIIIVPPLRQRPFRKYFGQNLALVASALTLLLLTINLASN
ncbi:MAG TPA: polysaccharide biosynthesis/export family protein [Cyclobacteriaceae bacterium]|nr:polysaccharide biosynthesis/export family protein [Cyclobacteriaceae bacterium]